MVQALRLSELRCLSGSAPSFEINRGSVFAFEAPSAIKRFWRIGPACCDGGCKLLELHLPILEYCGHGSSS